MEDCRFCDASLAYRAAFAVQNRSRELDENSKITSITPHGSGGVLVKVRPKVADAAHLYQVLSDEWPLATSSLVEDHVGGGMEVSMLIPPGREMRRMALSTADNYILARVLSMGARLLLLFALVTFVVAVTIELR